jgi:hypothetical protein
MVGTPQTFAGLVAFHVGTKRGARSLLAQKMGLSRSYICNVLAGRHVPIDPVRWADALGLRDAPRVELIRTATAERLSPEVRTLLGMA